MIAHNIEFHNVDHLQPIEHMPGEKLCRFPEEFSRRLGVPERRNGRFRAERPHGCELRFVTDAPFFDLALTAVEDDIEVGIYCGDYLHQKAVLKAGVCTVLHIESSLVLAQVDSGLLDRDRFDFKVWRVQFGMNGYVYFHYLNTFGEECRPPAAFEKPETTWLAYGSSITCGSVVSTYANAYINQAAAFLGYDVLNKGLSGSCMCEVFAADYLAQADCDVMTLELGINMVSYFNEEDFEKQISYLLDRVLASKAREIYVMDMFPYRGLILKDHRSADYRHYRSFKEIVRRLAGAAGDARVHLIHGETILKELSYLSTDLLHPSDIGHIKMGRNLADMMKQR